MDEKATHRKQTYRPATLRRRLNAFSQNKSFSVYRLGSHCTTFMCEYCDKNYPHYLFIYRNNSRVTLINTFLFLSLGFCAYLSLYIRYSTCAFIHLAMSQFSNFTLSYSSLFFQPHKVKGERTRSGRVEERRTYGQVKNYSFFENRFRRVENKNRL